MKKQDTEKLEKAVKDWIAHDLPPAEKAALNDTLLEALIKRFNEEEPEEPSPTRLVQKPLIAPVIGKPVAKPIVAKPVAAKPMPVTKPKMAAAKKHK